MGNISGKFPPQLLALLLFRCIQKHQNHAGNLLLPKNGVCENLADSAVCLQPLLSMRPCQRALHTAAHSGTAVQRKNIFALRYGIHTQKRFRRGVIGKNIPLAIHHKQTLLHIRGNRIEFLFSALQLCHLAVDFPILHSNSPQKRCQFLINLRLFGMLQINLIDGACDIFCCAEGKKNGNRHHHCQNQHQRKCHRQKYRHHTHRFHGKPQNRPICQSFRMVKRLSGKRCGNALAVALAALHGLLYFLTVAVVLHFGCIRGGIIQHCPICINPSDSRFCVLDFLQIPHAVRFNATGNIFCLSLQLFCRFLRGKLIHHPHGQQGNGKHNCRRHQKNCPKNTIRHIFPPTL